MLKLTGLTIAEWLATDMEIWSRSVVAMNAWRDGQRVGRVVAGERP